MGRGDGGGVGAVGTDVGRRVGMLVGSSVGKLDGADVGELKAHLQQGKSIWKVS